MFQCAYDPQAATGKKLRTLGALEEYFWLSENTSPHTTMILAEVEGATTVESWQEALNKVQQRYPLLSARIRKNAGERPYFETLGDTPLPFRVLPLNEVNLDALIAQEPVTSFGDAHAPLGRLTLCHGPERCAVLFAGHHAACDGKTNVRIVEDLIAAVSGEVLGAPFPLLPAIEEFFGLEELGAYTERLAGKAAPSDFPLSLPIPSVERQLLHAKDLKVLQATARAEGTTVQGALIAAFFLAGRLYSRRWRTDTVACFSPIDLRPMVNRRNAAGVLIGVHPSMMQPWDDLPFWEFARQLKQDMRASQTKEFAALVFNAVRQVVQREGDPDDMNTIDTKGFYNHDLLISNYGDPGVRTNFGHLRLKALYPSVITGGIDTQTISVLTVDGKLHITHISRQPFPSLVQDAYAILMDACGVSLMTANSHFFGSYNQVSRSSSGRFCAIP